MRMPAIDASGSTEVTTACRPLTSGRSKCWASAVTQSVNAAAANSLIWSVTLCSLSPARPFSRAPLHGCVLRHGALYSCSTRAGGQLHDGDWPWPVETSNSRPTMQYHGELAARCAAVALAVGFWIAATA